MKYTKQQYEEIDYFDDSGELSNYRRKLVKTRKQHICSICDIYKPAGTMMILEQGFLYNKPVSAYQCTDCLDEYLDESGMFEEV